MGLGGVGIKLSDLVMLYSGIPRLGTVLPLTGASAGPRLRCMRRSRDGCWSRLPPGMSAMSLPAHRRPENGIAGRIAFKTGTSYGYRDAWSVGFDGRYTIGVWVGRPDGAPVPGLIGRAAAAPILFDAFARLPAPPAALRPPPAGVLFATNAKLPPPLQRFAPGRLAGEEARTKLHILFPPDGARLSLPPTTANPIRFRSSSPARSPRSLFWSTACRFHATDATIPHSGRRDLALPASR